MANLAASAVTINDSWTEGGISGKRFACRDVTLVLTGQGTTTNLIGAAVLQLTKIEQCSNARSTDNASIYPAVPANDGSCILLANLAQATDANRDDPADITATIRLIVKGQP